MTWPTYVDKRWVIHNMHGPTVFQYDTQAEADARCAQLNDPRYNSGPYRVVDYGKKEEA